jgi:hypothetical protein
VSDVTLLSIVPALQGGGGHMLGYHLAVGRAAHLNGWRHAVATSPEHGLACLPQGWQATLTTGALETGLPQLARQGRLWRLLNEIRVFAFSIAVAVRAELNASTGTCVVFVERFNGPELLGVLLAALRLDRKRLQMWVLFRSDPASMGIAGSLYVGVGKALAALFGRERFRLLTDSVPLAEALRRSFGRPAHMMPVPHTEVSEGPIAPRSSSEVLCWWPGAARPEKGLDAITRLASHDLRPEEPLDPPVRLIVSRAAGVAPKEGPLSVQLVEDVLSPEDYQMWLRTADVILLPYSAQRYRSSTSGIFAECIAAGKIPLVSPGTWMAFELARCDLQALVCDWHDPREVLAVIVRAKGDPAIGHRLGRMRQAFLAFHSEASFAREMHRLIGPCT